LLHYLKDEAEREIPIWKMMSLTLDQLKVRAEAWREPLGKGDVVKSESTVGGGSLPDECIATYALALKIKSPDRFLKKLRECHPPIIARVENDTILFDPRTVLDDELLLSNLKALLSEMI
jgi:L-seryl-tRNA(Ser) seleniumtransferase